MMKSSVTKPTHKEDFCVGKTPDDRPREIVGP